jgi:beta-glucosidase
MPSRRSANFDGDNRYLRDELQEAEPLLSLTDSGTVPLPEGFLFGTATAAYQIEGSVAADGRGTSIWDTFSHGKGNTRNGDTGDISCSHFVRSEDDLDLMADLGIAAYRFSISWPRIQPTGKGAAISNGLDFYRRLLDGLRARGILPVLTLYHWDLPQALEDAGGWPERDTASRFADYAAIVARALGDDVGMWITLNEPWCSAWLGYGSGHHAPGKRDMGLAAAAHHHLLLAHGQAMAAIRSAVPGASVGISLNLQPVRAASSHEDDKAAAARVDGNRNRLFLDPIFNGRYPEDMLEHYRGRSPGFAVIKDGDLAAISRPLDFLGINFYSPSTVADESRAAAARTAGYCVAADAPDPLSADLRCVPVDRPDLSKTEMGWEVEPLALTELLTRVGGEHAGVPLLVTENGAAYADYVGPDGTVRDADRIRYLDGHLRAVLHARDAGVDVRGYFVWSLLDNFEWAHGYSKRFGLVWTDYPTGTRIPKDSFWWYRETLRSNALLPLDEAIGLVRG